MLTCAGVFSDHMVLQRGKPISVWGTAEPGADVTVRLGGEPVCVRAERDGRFFAILPPLPEGGARTLTVDAGGETVSFKDVLLGEVWLAGGQSNMEMALRDCLQGKKEAENSAGKNVRFYTVPHVAVEGAELERAEKDSRWRVCSPESTGDMSGVAWFFASRLSGALGVPVGIIDCSWGGTSISCWMGREQLEKTAAGKGYIDRYRALVGDKSPNDYRREMAEYFERWNDWNERVMALRAEKPKVTWEEINRVCGECPWPQPAGNESPFRPAGLYGTMLRRVCPYGLRGFLFYQGEEDVEHWDTYDQMMVSLIDQWRGDWGDMELPFLFTQLPMYCSASEYASHEDSKYWALMREKQWKVSKTVSNTALAVLIDCGEFDNIHPRDKRTVGTRLALLARRAVYGEDLVAEGPVPISALRRGGEVELRFRNTAGELKISGDMAEGFELAGADGVYCEARGELTADSVNLSSDNVPEPAFVRYAWTNYGPANLYNASMLPAAPFRMRVLPNTYTNT